MTKKITTKTEKPTPEAVIPMAPAQEVLTPKDQKEVRIIERVIENKEIAPADAFGKLSRPQIELIKKTVAKGASDDELRLFIQVCKGANLNPFLRQVHLVPRWDSKLGMEVRTIQVGIDGFRAVAESSGQYAGNEDPIYEGEQIIDVPAGRDQMKKLTVPTKATVTVYKLMEGQRYGFTATARWEEYYPGPKMGFQWHIRPYLMLGKCAEALALRKAFPKLLSGMYAAEEMDRGQSEQTETETTKKQFEALKKASATMPLAELKDYRKKMEDSDKYTLQQKAEYMKMVDERIAEINAGKQ